MTNQVNQAFEKWYKSKVDEADLNNDMDARHEFHRNKERYKYGYQAASQASESEINSLKQRVEELDAKLDAMTDSNNLNHRLASEWADKLSELQADNLRLREALKSAWSYTHTNEKLMDKITSLLLSTQSQSLAEHDNEVTAPYKKALEFAEYMAKSTEQFMIAINQLDEADQEEDEETIEIMQEKRGEHWRAVNSSIYEFRQRADRALKVTP